MTSTTRRNSKTEIQSRPTLDSRIDQAILWLTLAALIALPLIFSYFEVTAVFNELKVMSLHLTAGLIAILWSWQIVLRRVDLPPSNVSI
jgi:hypothetical protein